MDGRDGDVSRDEAAWLDLIARYDLPADIDPAGAPWPAAENVRSPAGTAGPADTASQPGSDSMRERDPRAGEVGSAADGGPDGESAHDPPVTRESGGAAADTAPASCPPSDPSATGDAAGDPAVTGSGLLGADTSPGAPPSSSDSGAARGDTARQPPGSHRARVVRHAAPPSQPPAAEDEDDRFIPYIPPPPPPLPKLDPVAKGAWAALCGGPAYLLVATLLSWHVSGLGALLAVTAFVGGFAVVVLRMGDRPSRGDDPDNGAVLLCSEASSAGPGQVSGTDKAGVAA